MQVVASLFRWCLLLAAARAQPCSTSATVVRDPHLTFAHGGRADFRGRHNLLYNFLSSPTMSVNVKTEEAIFTLHDGALTVNGTFITEAHIAARLPRNRRAAASFFSKELGEQDTGWEVVRGTCTNHPFKFGRRGSKKCYELDMAMDYSSATFELGNWTVAVHGMRSCRGCLLAGPEHRLDISFSARGDAPSHDRPHGIIGQSYATPGLVRHGNEDKYPWAGHYTTSAQAEGAIDGKASDYEVASAYATEFAFSRFNAARGAPASAEPTGGVDASSIDRIADPATVH